VIICFISDIYKDSETVIEQYRKRDNVEKFFENLKERIGLKRFLTGKQTVVDSKLFFAFIAFIIYLNSSLFFIEQKEKPFLKIL